MTRRVGDSDPNFRAFRSWFLGLNLSIFVGVRGDPSWGTFTGPPAGSGNEGEGDDEGLDVVGYASVNEFGSEDGRVPERSFMRSTLDEDEALIVRRLHRELGAVFDGKATAQNAADRVGVFVVGRIQRKIRNLDNPPNAAATIAKKGFDNPLIETGRLRQSIDHEVEGNGRIDVRFPVRG